MVKVPYTPTENNILLPFLSLQLVSSKETLNVMGLVESGVAMNLLPYDLGVMLGLVWEQQTTPITLTGQFANMEVRAVAFDIIVPSLSDAPIKQDFAWVHGGDFPVTLGNTFFMMFNISFYRSQKYFEIEAI
jgi:hypothetical protein